MNKKVRQRTASETSFDKSEMTFEVREVSGRAYVVVKESRKGSVQLQQSMTFASQSEFERWCVQERRRLEFPLAYDQLSKSVSQSSARAGASELPKEYGSAITELVALIAKETEEGQVLLIFQEAVRAMGGEAGVFCSFVRGDEGTESYRFLVACDPAWCSVYQEQNWFAGDPALIYAATRSEPIRCCDLPVTSRAQRELIESAARHGFVSGGVFPAPAGGRVSRIGALILGSSDPTYLRGDDFEAARMYGRVLSMELNEWWIRKIRHDIIATSNLTQEDITLLAFEKRGLKSKEIARELETTVCSIDSRFQRLNAKLHTGSRAESAKIAAEHGVI